jgi:hypothetical protein
LCAAREIVRPESDTPATTPTGIGIDAKTVIAAGSSFRPAIARSVGL